MTDNRTEEQRVWDEYETNREIIQALDAGEITYDDSIPVPELPEATPDNTMIVKTFRLPMRLDDQLRAIAKRRGTEVSALLREWVAEMIAVDAADEPVSRADIMRAIAGVAPLPHAS